LNFFAEIPNKFRIEPERLQKVRAEILTKFCRNFEQIPNRGRTRVLRHASVAGSETEKILKKF